jgi:hypothetical protein
VGLTKDTFINDLAKQIHDQVTKKNLNQRLYAINVVLAPVFDITRIYSRSYVTMSAEKTIAFPALEGIIERRVKAALAKLANVGSMPENDEPPIEISPSVKIEVVISLRKEIALCKSIFPKADFSTKKRKFDNWQNGRLLDVEVHRQKADELLAQMKRFSADRIKAAKETFVQHIASISDGDIDVSINLQPLPLYLLGRYRKFARDVPQSAWAISGSGGDGADGAGEERKGRNSVEEIITAQVKADLQAKDVKMHACGREDIDVRCLGNGRPFVLEIWGTWNRPDPVTLASSVRAVNEGAGLNAMKDVEIEFLEAVSRQLTFEL